MTPDQREVGRSSFPNPGSECENIPEYLYPDTDKTIDIKKFEFSWFCEDLGVDMPDVTRTTKEDRVRRGREDGKEDLLSPSWGGDGEGVSQ